MDRSNPLKRPATMVNSDRRSAPAGNFGRRTPFTYDSSDFNINERRINSERLSSIIARSNRPNLLPSLHSDEFEETEQENWENLKKWAASCVVMYAAYAACLCLTVSHLNNGNVSKSEVADYERHELMMRLTKMEDNHCYNLLRMGKNAFATLVHMLKEKRLLKDSSNSSVEEQLAKFLFIIGHNERNRSVQFFFQRSSETVSRHFHKVLKAIISLDDIFLKQPNGVECPSQIKDNPKYWPYFKDCVGAIDGSHFRVRVPSCDVQRYRGRKSYPTQNVLAACSFDLRFTYVIPGWEGSASDSRILNNALEREEDKLVIPQGKYYLVDAGFQLKTSFLAPHRSTRYHLKEYSSHPPRTENELFNLRHASLRNAIERAFGVLKKRFPILASGSEAFFDIDTQGDIILAGCILHNFLMGMDPYEELIAEVDNDIMSGQVPPNSSLADECREGEALRDLITKQMWSDYVANN